MAKYNGTYRCGCAGTIDIVGKTSERQRKADWTFNRVCPECWAKERDAQKEAERAETVRAAREQVAAYNLPPLRGTEKQVTWAETLRYKMINAIDTDVRSKLKPETLAQRRTQDALDAIIYNSDASYWIDNRGRAAVLVFEYMWRFLAAEEELGTLAREEAETEFTFEGEREVVDGQD